MNNIWYYCYSIYFLRFDRMRRNVYEGVYEDQRGGVLVEKM